MCGAISLNQSELPIELIREFCLEGHGHARETTMEFWFQAWDAMPVLPVRFDTELTVLEWGNARRTSSKLPKGNWCRKESLDAGKWKWLKPQPVVIPANFAKEKKAGAWFLVTEGMRGIVVRDENSKQHVYMLTTEATHYYQTMTRHNREPVFLGEQI
ncbi:MAG: hypothetical protein COA78_10895 [Blastopirellula sp.]|nr:MAG: hypothetical protein COA78_10895 [Blastopirellula sp.]